MKVAIDKIHGLGIASPSSSSSSSANDNASGSSGGYGANANNNNNDSNNNTADATWTNPSTGEVHPIHINNNVTLSKGIDKVSLFFNILFLVIAAFWIYSIMKAGSGGGVGSFFQSKFTPVENVNISFDDVIGNAEAKEELRDIVDFLKNPTPYRDQEIKVPKGVLLTGPPGTGKVCCLCLFVCFCGNKFVFVIVFVFCIV
jgi:ATP-dependent Zn protease